MEPEGDAFPDTDGHLRFSTQSQVDQAGPQRGNNGEQGSLRGTRGISWGVHPFKDITLTTTKRAVSLTGDTPDMLHAKLWAALPRPFDHQGEGVGCVHRWTEWPDEVFWILPTQQEASPMSLSVTLRFQKTL